MGAIAAIGIGSLAGGFARYYLAGFLTRVFGTQFPYGTFAVNTLGCFLIGFFWASSGKWALNSEARLLLMTGFCGAFTTFSTFILETAVLVKAGENLQAFLNVSLSLAAGFLVFKAGSFLAGI